MSHTTSRSDSEANSQTSHRVAQWLGSAGISCSLVGWVLEWIRQRGTCDIGNASPDTLPASVILIVAGGGALGVIALIVGLLGAARRQRGASVGLVIAVCSLVSALPILAFAGAGPGSWFQYCGT